MHAPSISAALNIVNSAARIPRLSEQLNNPNMQLIEEIHRARLEVLIAEAGSQKALADRIGKSPAQISQWINGSKDSKTGKPRAMGRNTARAIEAAFPKPSGWMDQPVEEGPGRQGATRGSGDVKASRRISYDSPQQEYVVRESDFEEHAKKVRGLAGMTVARKDARPQLAEQLADALGDALQGLPAAMYARSVDACRRLAEAPDSNRARTEMWDVLQHSDALRAPPVPPKSPAPIDKAFREAFYALLDEGPDSKARAIVNELRDAIEQRVASQLGIDRGQAQRALAARQ